MGPTPVSVLAGSVLASRLGNMLGQKFGSSRNFQRQEHLENRQRPCFLPAIGCSISTRLSPHSPDLQTIQRTGDRNFTALCQAMASTTVGRRMALSPLLRAAPRFGTTPSTLPICAIRSMTKQAISREMRRTPDVTPALSAMHSESSVDYWRRMGGPFFPGWSICPSLDALLY
jgi:hypothetical protein